MWCMPTLQWLNSLLIQMMSRFFIMLGMWMGFLALARADLTLVQVLETMRDDKLLDKEVMTIYIKDKTVRIDQGQALTSIIRSDQKVTYSILHESKKYVVLPHPPAKAEEADDLSEVQVESTGKKEQISGFMTHEVLVKEGQTTTDLWIGEGVLDMKSFLKEFQGFLQFGFTGATSLFEKYPELNGVPIRIVEKNQNVSRIGTITKVDSTQIPNSTFDVPAGYSELKRKE